MCGGEVLVSALQAQHLALGRTHSEVKIQHSRVPEGKARAAGSWQAAELTKVSLGTDTR